MIDKQHVGAKETRESCEGDQGELRRKPTSKFGECGAIANRVGGKEHVNHGSMSPGRIGLTLTTRGVLTLEQLGGSTYHRRGRILTVRVLRRMQISYFLRARDAVQP